ncbi:MAG: 4-(cytidine 5'-diphospho)-2-C-methyl-D-erythritol kinase [Candidatus Acidiferrales bacterium]
MSATIRVPAFAKINLRLQIVAKQADGYHELRTIFQTISLHDTLELARVRKPGIFLELSDPDLVAGPENLVWRAIEAAGCELKFRGGVRAALTKCIPVAGGLGGGSSDAAAALIGMLRLTGKKIPLGRLNEIAAGLGADVPFFLLGGRALGVNRGDEIYPLAETPKRSIVVISPREIAVSTREAFEWAGARLTNEQRPRKILEFCALCWSPREGQILNDFEDVVFERYPRLGKIKAQLLEEGAAEAALAGSGSAVFGIFQTPAKARRAARRFLEDQVFVVETLSEKDCARARKWRASA